MPLRIKKKSSWLHEHEVDVITVRASPDDDGGRTGGFQQDLAKVLAKWVTVALCLKLKLCGKDPTRAEGWAVCWERTRMGADFQTDPLPLTQKDPEISRDRPRQV